MPSIPHHHVVQHLDPYRPPGLRSRAVRDAAPRAGPAERTTCPTFRHSFATYLFDDGHDIRTVQQLLGTAM